MNKNIRIAVGSGFGILAAVLAVVAFLTYNLATTHIYPASVGVKSLLGHVETRQDEILQPGIHIVVPWVAVTHISTAQSAYEVESKDIGTIGDKNGVQVEFDVTLPYSIRATCAAAIVYHGGIDVMDSLIKRTAPSAMRDAASQFTWDEMAVSKRDALSALIQTRFSDEIHRDLVSQGYSDAEAKSCLIVHDVKLQRITPPTAVLNAIGEKAATQVTLDNQKALNSIADQEADRRRTEGNGIANLMDALPKNFTADQVAKILGAVAVKENADAVARAVRDGKINMMVIPSQNPVAVHAE